MNVSRKDMSALLYVKWNAAQKRLTDADHSIVTRALYSENDQMKLLAAAVITSEHIVEYIEEARQTIVSMLKKGRIEMPFIESIVYEALVSDPDIQVDREAVMDIIEKCVKNGNQSLNVEMYESMIINAIYILYRYVKRGDARANSIIQTYKLDQRIEEIKRRM